MTKTSSHLHIWSVLLAMLMSFGVVCAQDTLVLSTERIERNIFRAELRMEEGQYKDALKIVLALDAYLKPRQEEQPILYLKNLLLLFKLRMSTINGNNFAYEFLKKEITDSRQPTQKALLNHFMAEFLLQYYEKKWFGNSMNHIVEQDTNIQLWSQKLFLTKISYYYQASIEDEGALQTPIGSYSAIIQTDTGSFFAPTVYCPRLLDYLMTRAISYSKSQQDFKRPIDLTLNVGRGNLLSSRDTFRMVDFDLGDTFSTPCAVKLYQKWLNSLEGTPYKNALANVDLQRLEFCYQILPYEEKLYPQFKNALYRLKRKSEGIEAEGVITFALSRHLRDLANEYQTTVQEIRGKEFRWALRDAKSLCDTIVQKYPNTMGANKCEEFSRNLTEPKLSFKVESFGIPDKPTLATFSAANLGVVYFEVYNTGSIISGKQLYGKDFNEYLKKQTPTRKWSVKIEDGGDLRIHNYETVIPALSIGNYVLVISSSPQTLKKDTGELSLSAFFQVTDLDYLCRETKSIGMLIVVNRTTGKPMKGVKVIFYENQLAKDNFIRRVIHQTILSDDNGSVIIPVDKFKFYLSHDNDILYYNLKDYNGIYHSDGYLRNGWGENFEETEPEEGEEKVFFYTDRAIYRPGQTVYFKGIVSSYDYHLKSHIVTDGARTIVVEDAARKKIFTKDLVVNDFGSFQDSFVLPLNTQLGEIVIRDEDSYSEIELKVEEYKRPTFIVDFEPINGQHRIGDSVKIKGRAISYSGASISGAKVVVNVFRPIAYRYQESKDSKYSYSKLPSKQIVSIDTVMNALGEFEVSFVAFADRLDGEQQWLGEYVYEVSAVVTDINGETQEASTRITLGSKGCKAKIITPSAVNIANWGRLDLLTETLNRQHLNLTGTVKIEKLVEPKSLLKERFWEKTFMERGGLDTLEKYFPQYNFGPDNSMSKAMPEYVVAELPFNTEQNKFVTFSKKNWKVGYYRLTLSTKDKYGNDITDIRVITLYDTSPNANVPSQEKIFLASNSNTLKVGEIAKVSFGIAFRNQHVLVQWTCRDSVISSDWYICDGKMKTSICKVNNTYEGKDLECSVYLYRDNQLHFQRFTIKVMLLEDDLKMEFLSFRNKLEPGRAEEWSLKITGKNGKKVAAELLATMYDASLDKLVPNEFTFDLYNKLNPTPLFVLGNPQYAVQGDCRLNCFATSKFSKSYSELRLFKTLERRSFFLSEEDFIYRGTMDLTSVAGTTPRIKNKPDGILYMDDLVMYPEGVQIDEVNVFAYKVPLIKTTATAGQTLAFGVKTTIVPEEEPQIDKNKTEEFILPAPIDLSGIKARKNLSETVFFYPQLRTDANGVITIKFRMNESLTRWKFMALAHTQKLQSVISTRTVVTQKMLMVQPNAPRFLRAGDDITFSAKVSNLAGLDTKGNAKLELLDAVTMQPIDAQLSNNKPTISFVVKAGQSAALTWDLRIPKDFTSAVVYRIIASDGMYSDGEENILPVLSNGVLLSETLPIQVNGGKRDTFEFKRMSEVMRSSTQRPHQLSLDITSNPSWYALQGLTYLMEYPHECAEQTFGRFMANTLAAEVMNGHPKIKLAFEQAGAKGETLLRDNLASNPTLKSALLEETPWVFATQSKEKQNEQLGLLFDLEKLSKEQEKALSKLKERQLENGGFTWYGGSRASEYMTRYIMERMGHLRQLCPKVFEEQPSLKAMAIRTVSFCDADILSFQRPYRDTLLGETEAHYLYARSFFIQDNALNIVLSPANQQLFDGYMKQLERHWSLLKSPYTKGMLALAAHRSGRKELARQMVASLKKDATISELDGIHWNLPSGYYWYEMPIETQALMVEVFHEIGQDTVMVDGIKLWLLKQRKGKQWHTTKSTASACAALFLVGDNWLSEDKDLEMELGGKPVVVPAEGKSMGAGQFTVSWKGADIKPSMAKLTVANPNKVPAWGAMHYQYFEDYDKVTSFLGTPVKVSKALFVKRDTLERVTPNTVLKVGELVVVRISLDVEKSLEFVHVKDSRSSSFEPTNVFSGYKYQNRLSYYETTRDASTNFFLDYLPVGKHQLEYSVRVTHKGDFSNGVTTVQSMYAPEFTSHSEAVRIMVK